MVESSENMWSAEEGNGIPLQCSYLENSINSMKRQKNRTLKDELPRLVGAQFVLEINGEIISERLKRRNRSKNSTQLWM